MGGMMGGLAASAVWKSVGSQWQAPKDWIEHYDRQPRSAVGGSRRNRGRFCLRLYHYYLSILQLDNLPLAGRERSLEPGLGVPSGDVVLQRTTMIRDSKYIRDH